MEKAQCWDLHWEEAGASKGAKGGMLMRKAMLSCNLLHPWHALPGVKQAARTT